MERGVHGRFLDASTSVREAAIELVGKFILIRPELIPQYYTMLSERILVTYLPFLPFILCFFRLVKGPRSFLVKSYMILKRLIQGVRNVYSLSSGATFLSGYSALNLLS